MEKAHGYLHLSFGTIKFFKIFLFIVMLMNLVGVATRQNNLSMIISYLLAFWMYSLFYIYHLAEFMKKNYLNQNEENEHENEEE